MNESALTELFKAFPLIQLDRKMIALNVSL